MMLKMMSFMLQFMILFFSLNILMIRRYIVADMRNKEEDESTHSEDFSSYHTAKPKPAAPKISYKGLVS